MTPKDHFTHSMVFLTGLGRLDDLTAYGLPPRYAGCLTCVSTVDRTSLSERH